MVAAVAALLVASGCTQVHRGAAIKDPSADAAAVNVAVLDHGSYPGAALAPWGLSTARSGAAPLRPSGWPPTWPCPIRSLRS